MNDNLPLTDNQLCLATSRSLPADAHLDSDTAAARESFLSLGTATESAASRFDEAALLARLQQSCLQSPAVTLKPTEPKRDWLPLVLSGTLALAALIAIVRIATDSNSAEQEVATVTWSPSAGGAGTVLTPAQLTPAWNDAIDDEIAIASATLQQYSTRNHSFDGSLLNINDRLEALSQELSNETL